MTTGGSERLWDGRCSRMDSKFAREHQRGTDIRQGGSKGASLVDSAPSLRTARTAEIRTFRTLGDTTSNVVSGAETGLVGVGRQAGLADIR